MEQTNMIQIKKGEILFDQGDEDKVLYKVLSGEIALYINYGKREERELAKMKKEDCFGKMAVLENQPRTATAVATQDSILMAYAEDQLEYFIAQNALFALNIMCGLSAKLRNATNEIHTMQELLLKANKVAPIKGVNKYIQQHTEYDVSGNARFIIKL